MVSPVVLSCPACRSDLIVPLSFPEYQRPAGPEVICVAPWPNAHDAALESSPRS